MNDDQLNDWGIEFLKTLEVKINETNNPTLTQNWQDGDITEILDWIEETYPELEDEQMTWLEEFFGEL